MEGTEAMHSFGGLVNTGSALNIRVYLRSFAADCFFQVQPPNSESSAVLPVAGISIENSGLARRQAPA
ncbi:MAG TPA: hypothetical protein VJ437_08485 [Acidiferrobacterales bacterium]|nr:hypothetical protein [Acidiferrobacterales bacterium]